MKIEKNKVVELCYELVVDGEVADKTTKERPLDYIHGTGMLLEKFEKNVEGLEPGGKFSFTLTPAEGYGEVDPDRIIDLPKEAFEVNGQIQEDLLVPGTTVPLLNGRGQVIPGKVLEVSEKSVRRGCTAKMCISATAAADMEKAAATKADAMVTVTGAADMVKDITRAAAAMKERGTRRAAADMVKDITKAAAATERITSNFQPIRCGFYSRLYLQRF